MYLSKFTMYIYCLYIRLNVGIYSLHETCRIIPISPHVPAMLSKFTRLVPHQIAIFCFRKALFLMDVAPSWSWGLNLRQWGNSHLLLSRIPGTAWLDASPNGRHGRSWSFPTRWVSLNKTFSDPVLAMRIYKGEAGNVCHHMAIRTSVSLLLLPKLFRGQPFQFARCFRWKRV